MLLPLPCSPRCLVPTADFSCVRCLFFAHSAGPGEQVEEFADSFLASNPNLNVLVNNAGGMPAKRMKTAQGHEAIMVRENLQPGTVNVCTQPGRAPCSQARAEPLNTQLHVLSVPGRT